MSELKPCPFCGKRAELTKLQSKVNPYYARSWGVKCAGLDCYARIPNVYDKPERAVTAWNRRACDE